MGKEKGKKRDREEEVEDAEDYPSDDSVADEDFVVDDSESEEEEEEEEE